MSLPDAAASCSFQESSMSINVFQLVTEGCYHCVQWENHVHRPFSPMRYLVSPENRWKRVWLQHQHHWGQPAAHSKVKLCFIYTALVNRDRRTCLVVLNTPQPGNSHLAHAEVGYITLSSTSLDVCCFSLHPRVQWLGPVSYLHLRLHLSCFLHTEFSARREGWSHCTSHPLLWVGHSASSTSFLLAGCVHQGCSLHTADVVLGGSAALSPPPSPRDATLLEKDFEPITAHLLGKRSHLAEWENSYAQWSDSK